MNSVLVKADNQNIINARWGNVTGSPEELKNTQVYQPIQTPLLRGLGYWSYLQGPSVCENGDCGGTDNSRGTNPGQTPAGLLKIEVHGDLPAGVRANVRIQGLAPSTDSMREVACSGVLHPLTPATYVLLADDQTVEGAIYRPRFERQIGPGRWVVISEGRVEVLSGCITSLRIVYKEVKQ